MEDFRSFAGNGGFVDRYAGPPGAGRKTDIREGGDNGVVMIAKGPAGAIRRGTPRLGILRMAGIRRVSATVPAGRCPASRQEDPRDQSQDEGETDFGAMTCHIGCIIPKGDGKG